jgi:capsular polysaccharide export protein
MLSKDANLFHCRGFSKEHDVISDNKKSFLFLQTIASPFFLQLGKALASEGHQVHKINFNGGDWLFWHGLGDISFTHRPAEFAEFLAARLHSLNVSDIVLFGDCRPWHREAIRQARSLDISIWVYEEGYIRPHWITLERNGTNGHSSFSFPADTDRAVQNGDFLAGEPVGGGLKQRIAFDFAYNFCNLLLKWKFPHHRTHRPYVIWKRNLPRKSDRCSCFRCNWIPTCRYGFIPASAA